MCLTASGLPSLSELAKLVDTAAPGRNPVKWPDCGQGLLFKTPSLHRRGFIPLHCVLHRVVILSTETT
jgi:hypothetical protein